MKKQKNGQAKVDAAKATKSHVKINSKHTSSKKSLQSHPSRSSSESDKSKPVKPEVRETPKANQHQYSASNPVTQPAKKVFKIRKKKCDDKNVRREPEVKLTKEVSDIEMKCIEQSDTPLGLTNFKKSKFNNMSLPILNDQQRIPEDSQIDTDRILAKTKNTELRESPLK